MWLIGVVLAEFCPRIFDEGDAQGGSLGPCVAFGDNPLGSAGGRPVVAQDQPLSLDLFGPTLVGVLIGILALLPTPRRAVGQFARERGRIGAGQIAVVDGLAHFGCQEKQRETPRHRGLVDSQAVGNRALG